MLIWCRKLFFERPDLLAKWQEKYHYVLVDEFQDINQVQYEVIRMLQRRRIICLSLEMMTSQSMDFVVQNQES